MTRQRLSAFLIAAALLVPMTLGGAGAAQAGSTFDGRWYVVIRTVVGDCLPTMGYSLLVKRGEVLYPGGGAIRVGGRVDDAGRVSVGIRAAQRWAHALGRMNRTTGSGTWRGTAPGQKCSGRWHAQRSH
jgi:hypothetical protein